MNTEEMKKRIEAVESKNPDLIANMRSQFNELTKEQLVDYMLFNWITAMEITIGQINDAKARLNHAFRQAHNEQMLHDHVKEMVGGSQLGIGLSPDPMLDPSINPYYPHFTHM